MIATEKLVRLSAVSTKSKTKMRVVLDAQLIEQRYLTIKSLKYNNVTIYFTGLFLNTIYYLIFQKKQAQKQIRLQKLRKLRRLRRIRDRKLRKKQEMIAIAQNAGQQNLSN